MKKYGYDRLSGSLFSWEYGLQFEGIVDNPPSGAFESSHHIEDKMLGCAFMSGWSGIFITIYSDGLEEQYSLMGYDSSLGYWKGQNIEQKYLKTMSVRHPICVCGDVAKNPAKLAELCSRYPSSRMYVCPLTYELEALGVLVRNMERIRPCRIQLAWENRDMIFANSKEFDPALDGDGLGRMADLVYHGMYPVNQMMKTLGVSPFYGKTLHREWRPGCRMIVRRVDVDKMFPAAPISSKNYAATSVFVEMRTGDKFKEVVKGYNGNEIDVFVATDYVPGVSAFMRFLKTFSGLGHVFVSEPDTVRQGRIVPVFRSDRAYRVKREHYEQTFGLIRGPQDPTR